ncbi:murein L,D-transpeptidase family protein [Melioribacteraceae bacterium 4301-Me]|uniref:L,D-transpeptidase family protein n=1 Tax=Pyranulibacter aquaticus TaxID=3163344 RepID=UPI003598CBD2
MLKNIIYISGSVIVFFVGLIIYGIILNIREVPLQEAMAERGITQIRNPSIVVDLKNYRLNLFSDKTLLKSYKAVFGKSNNVDDNSMTGNFTPIGDYIICDKLPNYKYHKFLRINFPNEKDAADALRKNIISQLQFETILKTVEKNICPPSQEIFGKEIGIHGIGKYNFIFKNLPFSYNWTNGSIALSNENIDELYSVVKIGTPVKIIK